MRFYPVADAGQSTFDEGVLLCSNYPQCRSAYLVTAGIVVALPDELMDRNDRDLLNSRLVTISQLHRRAS
jgi:uncharacterized protein YbaR (Trm112 family)